MVLLGQIQCLYARKGEQLRPDVPDHLAVIVRLVEPQIQEAEGCRSRDGVRNLSGAGQVMQGLIRSGRD